MPPPASQTTGTLMVNKETGAITGPVDAETFAEANNLGGGAPEAHAASHAAAGSDPVTLAQSQVTNLTTDLAAKQPLATVLTNTTAAFTTAQETKLAGVATGATANSSDATLLARANHTGTQSADTLTDGTTNKAFLATERTKLAGIATAATANDTDANLRDRATHTGAQAISTVTGLQAALDGKQPLATVLTNTTAAFTTAQETKLAGIESGAQANGAIASQAEAEAGVETTKTMTPQRVAQAIAALADDGGVTSVDGQTGAVDTGYDDRITALENVEPTASGSNLVSGGGVSLTGGLTLTVSAALYNILGVAKSSAETILTAATADATHPRYDVVALDDTGTAVLITGTPAATPVVPTVDPATQLYLTFISVPAGATSISGTETIIYDSNDDYTMTEGGTSVVLNSSNNPRGGSGVCIEATTMVPTDYFQAQTPSGTIDLGTFNVLRFFIRNKAAWHASKQITITARMNGVQVGSAIVFKHGLHAFDQTNVTTYQQISINPNLFAAGGQAINQLRWTCAGGGSAITGFYVDDIVLQAGVSQSVDSTRLRDRGAHDSGIQYDVNDLAYTGSTIYKAKQQTPVGAVQTNTTYWEFFASRLTLGTGVATALAVNVGSAGAPVVLNGAGGTPSSINLSNATSFPAPSVVQASMFAADAGSTDAYVVALTPTLSAYVTGTGYRFKANTANTGGATVDFGPGAKTIVKVAGGITTALATNDILAGQWVDLVYDGTNMQMQSTLGNAPSGSGSGTVNSGTANQVAYYPASSAAVSGSSVLQLDESAGTVKIRKDQNGSTNLNLRNDNTGTSALPFISIESGSNGADPSLIVFANTNWSAIAEFTGKAGMYANIGSLALAAASASKTIDLYAGGVSSGNKMFSVSSVEALGPEVRGSTNIVAGGASASANHVRLFISGGVGYVSGLTGGAAGVIDLNIVGDITKILAAGFAETARFTVAKNLLVGTTSESGISGAGNVKCAAAIMTGAPSGGTAAAWKLGTVASVSPTSPNRTIELDIGGTIYYLHAKTTNN